ncbi:MAG: hypothetical protein A2176_00470 [Spirochaetes bacterium RBG_13_51_14]|nr:MAG: hypothetical protein A2176_00470 [Spirochaetes bacterium RBG_13_51_14]
MHEFEQEISEAAGLLLKTGKAAAFCGSGISAESGIATFRDPGGIWDRIDPMEFGTPEGFIGALDRNPGVFISIFFELLDMFEKAECNPGHKVLADLENRGVLGSVITQNVDNLQSEAGSAHIIELHGNLFRMICLSCGKKKMYERKPFIRDLKEKIDLLSDRCLASLFTLVPTCDDCGSITRPDVVLFGETVQELPRAYHAARDCAAMLVLGTSGAVYPAAALPYEAKERGAPIIVINPNENAFEDIADVYIPMKTGVALPLLLKKLKEIGDS